MFPFGHIWDLRYLPAIEVREQKVYPRDRVQIAWLYDMPLATSTALMGRCPHLGENPWATLKMMPVWVVPSGRALKSLMVCFIIVKDENANFIFCVFRRDVKSALYLCWQGLGFTLQVALWGLALCSHTSQGISFIANCKGTWCVCKLYPHLGLHWLCFCSLLACCFQEYLGVSHIEQTVP